MFLQLLTRNSSEKLQNHNHVFLQLSTRNGSEKLQNSNHVFLQLSTIGRCEYEKTCALLVQLFDESARRYEEMVTTRNQSVELAIEEG